MSQTFSFGGQTHLLRPLTLNQLKDVLPAFAQAGADPASGQAMEAAKTILAAATGLGLAAVGALPTDLVEITRAIEAVAEISGLTRLGQDPEPSPGE